MLKIQPEILANILAHAERELPHEACGYLAAANDGLVSYHYEMTNTDKAADHFSMDPKEQFAAVKDMRARGLSLCAVYHSHPETQARPSLEDIRLAYDPDISYVIISLANRKQIVKAFRINKGEVESETIAIYSEEEKEKIDHR